MNNKKIATAILAFIFVILFVLVGFGSCGGIKYLIDKRQSVATVYADEVGSGSVSTEVDAVSVTLNKYSFYVDGYRGNGFPSVIDYSEYMPIGEFRFVAVYNDGKLVSFFVTTVELVGDIFAGGFSPIGLFNRNTDLTSTNLVNIAFLNVYRGIIEPGCLEFSGSLIDIESCGRFVSANVNIIGDEQPYGRFNLSLVFENSTYDYIVSPFGWAQYGDYEVNKLLGHYSYRETFSVATNSSTINPQSYFQEGYDKAIAENKDKWISEGYDSGYVEGESIGYNTAIEENQDIWYNSGYEEGESVGYNTAIEENRDIWYNSGYDAGLIQGANSANEYSFIGLIGAVIDVPVKAFIGLTDFNLFGFNMTTFYKAIFAFCTMVIIVRIILP